MEPNEQQPIGTILDIQEDRGIEGLGDGFTKTTETLNCDEIYIGTRARFVGLSNGVKLEVMNSGGTWVKQAEWTES